MNQSDVIAVLNIVNAMYPFFSTKLNEAEKRAQVQTWYAMLKNDDVDVVKAVLQKYLATEKFPPTVAAIREGIRAYVLPDTTSLFDELVEAGKLSVGVRENDKGEYVGFSKKDFERLSEVTRAYTGNVQGLQIFHMEYCDDPIKARERFNSSVVDILKDIDVSGLNGRKRLK